MSVATCPRFQILINPESKKVQGLRTGDIVRRQYFDGKNIVYSLMCVTDYGVEQTWNFETSTYENRPYFVGALLEGDEPDPNNTQELLDFARVTNLFDTERSGALYLTASDDKNPYMDIIDGIGRNKSLSWPENLPSEFEDAKSQYIVRHNGNLTSNFLSSQDENHRILTIVRGSVQGSSFEGLEQDFYEYVAHPNKIVVSYKIRSSKPMTVQLSLGYSNDPSVNDGTWEENSTDEWSYKLKVVTIDYSGRHLRALRISMENLEVGEEVQISDFNIILLSSLSHFNDASTSRFGRLDGVVDPVFGQLSGYGAYMQKLFASKTANVSGTLTAGDENGFGATFYAGKIHRNCFKNSVDVNALSDVSIDWYFNEYDEKVENFSFTNPTGVGHVYKSESEVMLVAQDGDWLREHIGKRYCFSFWVYPMQSCGLINITQNNRFVGSIRINGEAHKWIRVHTYFDLTRPEQDGDSLILGIIPSFIDYGEGEIREDGKPDEKSFYFTAPQLESGETATQYQPTDGELNYTDNYGAWFNEGGIGGTIQNPLLRLNYDGSGAIDTRTGSFRLNTDGSGYLANTNIQWDRNGNITFGSGVSLGWGNMDEEAQDKLRNRYIKILGKDTFSVIGQNEELITSPDSIVLTLEERGFDDVEVERKWYSELGGLYTEISNGNSSEFVVYPDDEIWNGASSLTIKCVVKTESSKEYSDTITIKKTYVQGYSVMIVSSKGNIFHNGTCHTVLTAYLYYQGKLVTDEEVLTNFNYIWHRYSSDDRSQELPLNTINPDDHPANEIEIDYELSNTDIYVCEIVDTYGFNYDFNAIL